MAQQKKRIIEAARTTKQRASDGDKASLEVGNFYKRVISILPEERWPVWQVSRIYKDHVGTLIAILTTTERGTTQRAISVDALENIAEWRRYENEKAQAPARA